MLFDCKCNTRKNSLLLNQHNGDDAPQKNSVDYLPCIVYTSAFFADHSVIHTHTHVNVHLLLEKVTLV